MTDGVDFIDIDNVKDSHTVFQGSDKIGIWNCIETGERLFCDKIISVLVSLNLPAFYFLNEAFRCLYDTQLANPLF